jgi:hypothetical protein
MADTLRALLDSNHDRATQRHWHVFDMTAAQKAADGDRLLGVTGRVFCRAVSQLIPIPKTGCADATEYDR